MTRHPRMRFPPPRASCNTIEFASHLLEAAPSLEVICWTTLVEDSAARAFSKGVYATIAQQAQAVTASSRRAHRPKEGGEGGPSAPAGVGRCLGALCAFCPLGARREDAAAASRFQTAFWAGCQAFTEAGFKFGNPEDYLHRDNHPHVGPHGRPEFNTCPGCTPPVQGMPVLLRMVGGEVVRSAPKAFDPAEAEAAPGPGRLRRTGSDKNVLASLPGAVLGLAAEVGLVSRPHTPAHDANRGGGSSSRASGTSLP